MPTVREELLRLVSELRRHCEGRSAASQAFAVVEALSRAIAERAGDMEVWRLAREIAFKASDLFSDVRRQEEFVLQRVLADRINRLEALIRVGERTCVEKRKASTACEFRRRWSDELLLPAA